MEDSLEKSDLERRLSSSTSNVSTNHPNEDAVPLPQERDSEKVQGGEDIIPNGGYGWVVTFCVALINAHTWGINSVSSPTLTSLTRSDLDSRPMVSSYLTTSPKMCSQTPLLSHLPSLVVSPSLRASLSLL